MPGCILEMKWRLAQAASKSNWKILTAIRSSCLSPDVSSSRMTGSLEIGVNHGHGTKGVERREGGNRPRCLRSVCQQGSRGNRTTDCGGLLLYQPFGQLYRSRNLFCALLAEQRMDRGL